MLAAHCQVGQADIVVGAPAEGGPLALERNIDRRAVGKEENKFGHDLGIEVTHRSKLGSEPSPGRPASVMPRTWVPAEVYPFDKLGAGSERAAARWKTYV